MNAKSTLSLTVCALLARGVAVAQPAEGSWETTVSAGIDGIPRETLLKPDITPIADLGTVDPVLAGDPGTLTFEHLAFHDALHVGPQFALESGYWASQNFEPFVRFDYAKLHGETLDMGTVSSPALTTAAPIRADFDNRDAESLALGSRYFFTSAETFRPYVTGFIGLTHQDALRANLGATGIGLASESAVLLPSATKFDAGVEAGLSYAMTDRADLRVSAGAQYLAGGNRRSTAFERFGLGPVDLGAPHWSVPLNIGVSYQF